MPEEKEEKERTKVSIYMDRKENADLNIEVAQLEKITGRHISKSDYLLECIRHGIGKASMVIKFAGSKYDWQDQKAKQEGREPDRDRLEREIPAIETASSLVEYREMLLELKRENDEELKKARLAEIKREILDERLEMVEHLLEKNKK